VQCFGGAKNHMIVMPDADMDQAVDALIGAGYGAAGERCMAVSVAVPVGEETADRLIEKLVPRVEKLKIGPYTAGDDVDFGPLVTKEPHDRVKGLSTRASRRARAGRRRPRFLDAGLRERLLHRRLPVRPRHPGHGHLQGPRSSARSCRSCAPRPTRKALDLAMSHEYGNGVAIFTRDGDAARDFRQPHQYRHGRHQRADPGAARLSHLRRLEEIRLRRPQPARPRRLPLLHPHQDGHLALAVGHQGRRGVRHSDDESIGSFISIHNMAPG
jgi:hypothetical protein